MRISLKVALIVMAMTGAARGENIWTLEDCLAMARSGNPSVERAEADVASSKGTRLSSWSYVLPEISAYGDVAHYSKEQASYYQDQLLTSKERYSWGVRLTQPIFNGGASWAQMSSARAGVRAAEQSFNSTWAQVALSVAESFYQVLHGEALIDVALDAEELAGRQLERAQERYRMGAASRQEVLKAKVTLQQDKLEKMRRENELATTRASLLLLLGKEPGTEFTLVAPPVADIDVPPLEECMEKGQQHPTLEAYRENLTSARKSVTSARGAWYPSLTGSARYGWSDIEIPDDADRYKENESWSLGLTMGINIFDGLSTMGSVQQAKASARQATATLNEQELTQRHNVEDSHRQVLQALAEKEVAAVALELAEEEYRLAEEQYGMGSLSFLELSDSKLALQQAKVDAADAIHAVYMARATLAEAIGELGAGS